MMTPNADRGDHHYVTEITRELQGFGALPSPRAPATLKGPQSGEIDRPRALLASKICLTEGNTLHALSIPMGGGSKSNDDRESTREASH
jgi:hypothetical protein